MVLGSTPRNCAGYAIRRYFTRVMPDVCRMGRPARQCGWIALFMLDSSDLRLDGSKARLMLLRGRQSQGATGQPPVQPSAPAVVAVLI